MSRIITGSAIIIGVSTINKKAKASYIIDEDSVFMQGFWRNNSGWDNKHTWKNG